MSTSQNLVVRGQQSMARALRVLSELVQSDRPMTATELGERVGLHQSTVSRMLQTFQSIGFVRKPDYHRFAADIGLAVFAGRAAMHFPMIRRTLPALRRRASECDDYGMTLCALWRHELVVLLKRDPHGDFHVMPSSRSPLHLAAAGLRHLLELPDKEAIACLEHSREVYGWGRPTHSVPATPERTLAYARRKLDLDVLTLCDWAGPNERKAAIPIRQQGQIVATAVVYQHRLPANPERMTAVLHSIARDVEAALAWREDAAEPALVEGADL